jgi:uncharacterized protein YbjT (DUF2867 family)
VRLDYGDPATLSAAVAGVDAVYLASPGDFPADPEQRLVDAARAAGVKKLVKLSALGVENTDTPLRQVERHVEASGIPFTILRPSWFFQNFSTSSAGALREGTLAEPAGTRRTAFIDARDIAEVAAEALTRPGHDGKAYTLTGPELLDRAEIAATVARELGRPVKYLEVTDEQFRAAVKAFLPPSYVEVLSTLYAGVRAGWYELKTDDVQRVLGRPPRSFAQFVKDHRAVWA